MKTVFIIRGFDIHSTAASDELSILRDGLAKKGYRVVPVDISWRQTTPSQFTREFIRFYEAHKTDHNTVIGNSFGAVVAFLSAPTIKPDKLFLCSLSPFFREDRGAVPDAHATKRFGKRRMRDLWSHSFDEHAAKFKILTTKTTITYGEQELQTLPHLVKRCKDAAAKIPGATLQEIADAPHSMRDTIYTDALIRMV